MRLIQEVGRALARAADARELKDLLRVHTHLVKRVDDALGDGVVAASGAQRGLCLLYTSPSPRDRTRSRMTSSARKKKNTT